MAFYINRNSSSIEIKFEIFTSHWASKQETVFSLEITTLNLLQQHSRVC